MTMFRRFVIDTPKCLGELKRFVHNTLPFLIVSDLSVALNKN